MSSKTWHVVFLAALTASALPAALAQQNRDWGAIQVSPHQLTDKLYYLEGSGGHIGLLIGDDGIIMIDDQFAPLSEKILAAIRGISDQPIRFLINTHVHGDHTGGNANFGGMGIPIVASDNVYVRLSQGSSPKAALPVLTFSAPVTLHLNGEDINIVPTPPAHTDGDSYVHFTGSDVIHAGDVFRTVAYPRVDTENGGTFAGTLEALQLLIDMAGPSTRIIPGHGVVSTREDVVKFRDMAIEVRDRVSQLMREGRTLEQIVAAKPTADIDAEWGFEPPDLLLPVLYEELR
ncbi:MAG TPA: MBL fold metallo-hydrolase [Gammaproteobacteria bacterium]|nr:MBL fold metallo-hydrolase [Gammaproteobacteria bacterium]